MKVYLVGGAVRDRLLGLPVRDRDWVVVGATEDEMLAQGFTRADIDFPVYLHPVSGDEYALARREIKTEPGYKGFSIDAGPDVSLEQDLIRRDLTINAIAEDETGNLIDPFGGRSDLNTGVLRHISPAFVEDPVRLLRVARFAARLGRWGFRVSHATHGLMRKMAASGELETLRGERIWQEMKQALSEDQPWRFYQVLQRCGALALLNPQLSQAMSLQSTHSIDTDCPMVAALKRSVELDASTRVRFSVVFFHAAAAAEDIAGAVGELRVEKEYLDLLNLTVQMASVYREAAAGDAQRVLDLIEGTRALQHASRLQDFLCVADALWPELEQAHAAILQALERVAVVSPAVLRSNGLEGAALGQALRRERLKALNAHMDKQDRGNKISN